jgi:hypothetical protein
VEDFFDALVKDLLPVDRPVAARAAALRGKHTSLKMPDALILATADLHAEIGTILCADGDWPKVKGLSCKVELLKVDPPKGDHSPGSRLYSAAASRRPSPRSG